MQKHIINDYYNYEGSVAGSVDKGSSKSSSEDAGESAENSDKPLTFDENGKRYRLIAGELGYSIGAVYLFYS